MKTISKKCQPLYFQQIIDGAKRFEIRLNHLEPKDVDGFTKPGEAEAYSGYLDCYEVGDTLLLKEYRPPVYITVPNGTYTGRGVACRITSVAKISINPINKSDGNSMWVVFPHIVFDEHIEFWTPEQIGRYGLVVLGIEVLP